MVQFAFGLDFKITLWHSEQVKASLLWKVTVSRSSSLLAVGVDTVSLISALSSLPVVRSNSMIVGLHSDVLSHCGTGCAFEIRCDVTNSAGCSVVDEPEALSAFAAQDLRVRDRAAVRTLVVIGLAPLSLHRPGHTATTLTSGRYDISGPLVSLTSC